MRKLLSLLLSIVMCVSLSACGKSDIAAAMDQAIEDLGTITLESEEAIIAAEKMYEALTEEQKAELDNYALLVSARATLDELIEASLPTKEEMLETATAVTIVKLNNAALENIVKATQLYCNQVLQVYGQVHTIKEDHVVLSSSSNSYNGVFIDVYLPPEELLMLEHYQWIDVVGITGDSIETKAESGAMFSWEELHYKMENAHFVTNTREYTAEYWRKNNGLPITNHGIPHSIDLNGDIYLETLYIPASVDTSNLSWGDKITFTAKTYENPNAIDYSVHYVLVDLLKVE